MSIVHPDEYAELLDLREKIVRIRTILEDPFADFDLKAHIKEALILASRGATASDIAEIFGKSESAVNAYLVRGLAAVQLAKKDLPDYVIGQIASVVGE